MSSYLTHFGLQELPFKITPDPRYMKPLEQHTEALEKCLATIYERGGIVAVYGEPGMGKSTIARALIQQVQADDCQVEMILNPTLMTEVAFMKAIMKQFGVKTERSAADSMESFQDFMQAAYSNGKNLVLIIDEAQILTPKMLKVLHALHNFESNTDKYLQIVLIGQEDLVKNIERVPNFKDRIARFARLRHLTLDDTRELIAFRWQIASGAKSSDPFTDKAIEAIYAASGGRPRKINQLCHESLTAARYLTQKEVDENMVFEAAKELLLAPDESEDA
jgi:general secretion pathway protein A